jgi:hypothetical protein
VRGGSGAPPTCLRQLVFEPAATVARVTRPRSARSEPPARSAPLCARGGAGEQAADRQRRHYAAGAVIS